LAGQPRAARSSSKSVTPHGSQATPSPSSVTEVAGSLAKVATIHSVGVVSAAPRVGDQPGEIFLTRVQRLPGRPQKALVGIKISIGLGRDCGSRSPKRGLGTTRFWGRGSGRDPALDWKKPNSNNTRVWLLFRFVTGDYGRSAFSISSRANGAFGEQRRHETHEPSRVLEVPEPQPIGSAFEPEIEISR
jgi:hypothetical protein